jgi:hypothetical protein
MTYTPRTAIVLFFVLSVLLALSTKADAVPEIAFASAAWKITIHPETLQVTATPTGSKTPLHISAAQPTAYRIANLKISGQQAQWDLPDAKLTVSMRLEGEVLIAGITAQTVGAFTWPALPAQPTVRGYILPIGEGVYAPSHDPEWSAHLEKREALSTTDGLFLPLWGLDCGDHTLTYMLTNPFNNELAFQNVAGGLTARFTHRFAKNWKV